MTAAAAITAAAAVPAFGQTPPSLPAGTAVTLVLDDAIPSTAPRVGTTYRVHVRDAIVVGSITAVAAGAADRIRVLSSRAPSANAALQITLAVDSVPVGSAGKLPLRLMTPAVAGGFAVGTELPAATSAVLAERDGVIAIRIPLPFRLSDEQPHTDWTPIPLRTAAGSRGPTPSPAPSTRPSATPAPAASAAPATAAPFRSVVSSNAPS